MQVPYLSIRNGSHKKQGALGGVNFLIYLRIKAFVLRAFLDTFKKPGECEDRVLDAPALEPFPHEEGPFKGHFSSGGVSPPLDPVWKTAQVRT